MKSGWISLFFAGWVLAWSGLACAEPVDPRNPAEWRAMQAAESRRLKRWMPDRIRQSNYWNTSGVINAGFGSIDAEMDSVTNRVSTDEHPEQFIRLRVE